MLHDHAVSSDVLHLCLSLISSPRHLCQQSVSLQGSSIFCISSDKRSRQQLSFAPRSSTDLALTQPESYLGGEPLGLCPEQLDTVIAYQLLIEVPFDNMVLHVF